MNIYVKRFTFLFALPLLLAGFVSIATPADLFANTKAEDSCEFAYTNTDLKNACVRGYTTQGSCTPYSGESRAACERGAEDAKAQQARAQNLEKNKECGIPATPGSMICQISRLIGLITDGLFSVLERMLVTPSLDQNKEGGREVYQVWAAFRNIANVVLVIVIMSILFSQVTNYGINNYGIKKLLPRLIVGALLINLSYIICGLIIDATNAVGTSLKDILVSVALPVKPNFDAWSGIIGAALAGAAGVAIYFNIFAIAPIIFSGLVALLLTVVILVARQALLIVLVIIAPVAFALNILPSTQKWFSKWWSSFIILACVFPIIAFIFGATRVAAGVISASAPDDPLSTVIFGVFSLGVLSLPFFLTPILMKVGGGLLNRFAGIVNNPSKGLIDRGRKQVDRWAKNKTTNRETNALMGKGKGLYATAIRRKNLTDQVAKHHKDQLKSSTSGAFGKYAGSDEASEYLADKASGAAGRNVFDRYPTKKSAEEAGAKWLESTGAAATRAEAIKESLGNVSLQIEVGEIDAAEAVLVAEHNTTDDFRNMIYNGRKRDGTSVTQDEKNAAIKHLAKQGNVDDIHRLINEMHGMQASSTTLRALADGIDASGVGAKAAHLGPQGTQMIRSGGANTTSLYHSAINNGTYNAETLASQGSKALRGLEAELANPGIDNGVRGRIRENRDLIAQRPKLQGQVSPKEQSILNNL